MDEQRLYLLSSLQRARQRQFDGPPVAPWEVSGVHSLPPVPDKPKKVVKAAPVSHTPMASRPNVERITTPEGKAKWVLAPQIVQDVRAHLLAGDTAKMIAKVTGLSISAVNRVTSGMRKEMATTPAPIHPPEAARTHVLDWRQRMGRYDFEGRPGQGKPKSVKLRKHSSTSDFRDTYPWPHLSEPMTINPARPHNCAASANAPGLPPAHASTESPRKALKTRHLSQNVAGQKGFDVESLWRTACTA